MRQRTLSVSLFSAFWLFAQYGYAAEQFPEKMLRDMECLRNLGLIQGTVSQVLQGEAHFAPWYRETAIGARVPEIRYNGAFIEGKAKLSPDLIKQCIPNLTLRKIN